MHHYTEQDPLLSRDKSSSEIKVSNPTSQTEQKEDNQNDFGSTTSRGKRSFNDLMAVVLGLCSALILTMLVLPNGFIDDTFPRGWPFGHQNPKTIEERVDKILLHTPLIGR